MSTPTPTVLILLSSICWAGLTSADTLSKRVQKVVMHAATEAYPDASISVNVEPFDARLKLAPCEDLRITPRGAQRHGRVPVAVSCKAPSPWSMFMTTNVEVLTPVVKTKAPLQRGEVLTAANLTTEPQDVSRLRRLYFTSVEEAAGQVLKRPLAGGDVVYGSMLRPALAVRKGDRITILASAGSVAISVPGESLENGMAGEQIRVRNRQSGKIVHAWVSGPGRVSTRARIPGSASGGD